MTPKTRHTKESILAKALELTRKEGIDNLSARNLAKHCQMSVIPIYSTFGSMDLLEQELLQKAKKVLLKYMEQNHTGMRFLDMGIGYIRFAENEKQLFYWMFQKKKTFKENWDELIEDIFVACIPNMRETPFLENLSKNQLREILFSTWVYTHGLASLICSNSITVSQQQIVELLQDVSRGLCKQITSK